MLDFVNTLIGVVPPEYEYLVYFVKAFLAIYSIYFVFSLFGLVVKIAGGSR